MSPMQQIFLGLGKAPEKTYIDNIFSTYLWKGTGAAKTISNGINLSEDGGMIWIKNRPQTYQFIIQDTEQGTSKSIATNSAGAQQNHGSSRVFQFNTNGFRVASDATVNGSNNEIASWTFKKTPKFFDIIKYTGNGTARTISHNLECIPGMIVIKSLTQGGNWRAYHRGVNNGVNPENYYLRFNSSSGQRNDTSMWQDTAPTSSVFSVQADNNPDEAFYINKSGEEYIAYLFAGGESTAGTARSVDFDGSNDLLAIGNSSDFNIETNWTTEGWFKCEGITSTGNNDGTGDFIFGNWENNQDWKFEYTGTDLRFYYGSGSNEYMSLGKAPEGTWNHIAASKEGTNTRVFLNGTQIGDAVNIGSRETSNHTFTVGAWRNNIGSAVRPFNGQVSNIRILKGTALYTSSFKPPTEPLENITNTVLLFCNNSSVTGSTVSPGTVTTGSSPTARTDSPFDDLNGFSFGESGSENIVKCGMYIGNGSSDGPDIYVGFEPQWLLIKRTNSDEDWMMFDSMRTSNRNEMDLDDMRHDSARAEGDGAGGDSNSYLNWTSTGFKLKSNTGHTNGNNDNYLFCAIRRPDGYVGKPPELGTEVFAMDTGNSSSTIPTFDSGFPVDFLFQREPASGNHWRTSARLIGRNYLNADGDDDQTTSSYYVWDSNVGALANSSWGSSKQAWMWKRHAGFDVVVYKGNDTNNRRLSHSLSKTPEMIWTKNRDQDEDWVVYHKDLASGYFLRLNLTNSEGYNNAVYEGNPAVAPTSTHWQIGDNDFVNDNNRRYLSMLFASVDGISKVGSYNGSTSNITITTGFQPRFILIKGYDSNSNGRHWIVMDSLRGINPSGNTDYLYLEASSAQNTGGPEPYISGISSTGFTLLAGKGDTSVSTRKYIYYAHA